MSDRDRLGCPATGRARTPSSTRTARAGELRLQRCAACGDVAPSAALPLRGVRLGRRRRGSPRRAAAGCSRGRSRTAPSTPRSTPPYAIVVVELEEGPRLVGNLARPRARRSWCSISPSSSSSSPSSDTVALVSLPAGLTSVRGDGALGAERRVRRSGDTSRRTRYFGRLRTLRRLRRAVRGRRRARGARARRRVRRARRDPSTSSPASDTRRRARRDVPDACSTTSRTCAIDVVSPTEATARELLHSWSPSTGVDHWGRYRDRLVPTRRRPLAVRAPPRPHRRHAPPAAGPTPVASTTSVLRGTASIGRAAAAHHVAVAVDAVDAADRRPVLARAAAPATGNAASSRGYGALPVVAR